MKTALSIGLVLAALIATGCETYDSPPRPSIVGLTEGVLADPGAPIVIQFSEPIVADTLKIAIVRLVTDQEGNLLDEDDDDATVLEEYFHYDPTTANIFGGTGTLSDDRTQFVIEGATLPIGTSLAVLIEPGLSDDAGRTWAGRQRLVFGYGVACDAISMGTDKFPSGTYFFLANVTEPIDTQIQLFARIYVDPDTGKFHGQFTNADRNSDPGRCDPACDETQACRLLPSEACVTPSEKAGAADEYPDFLPNDVLPTGYSFTVDGCVVDSGDSVAFVNLPADVVIQQPAVTVQGIQLTSSFRQEGDAFIGTGSVTAAQVLIGTTESGKAVGTMVAARIPDELVPPGVPEPPP